MKRIAFAIAVATLSVAAVSGTSQAAPIAPLSSGITATDNGNVTQVRWGYHRGWGRPGFRRGWRRHCWWRHGRRHCW